MVNVKEDSQLYQKPHLSCSFSNPDEGSGGDWNEIGDEKGNDGEMDVLNPKSPPASSSSSSSSVKKRKRGDKTDAKVGLDLV